MFVIVDRKSEEPVYGQIARQIRCLVASGRLGAGAPLPAVRTLASDLGVNLNTVARAYRRLEQEGFIRIRERAGAEVLPPSRRTTRADRRRLEEELRELLVHMRQAGMSNDEIRDAALEALHKLEDPASAG